MPRFSVTVPAYQVQARLHECLASVLSPSWPDLEAIAVDDGSPDACGEIIDAFAARDPRVRPLHLPDDSGPGPGDWEAYEAARGTCSESEDELIDIFAERVVRRVVPAAAAGTGGEPRQETVFVGSPLATLPRPSGRRTVTDSL